MRDARELDPVLRRIALRCGIGAAARTLARSAAAASAGLLCWAAVTLIAPLPFPLGRVAAALAVLLAAASPVLAWWHRPSLRAAAQVADRRLGLADRLGTAVELLDRPRPPEGLERLQVAWATATARGIAPRAVAPLRVPREAWAAVAGGALLALYAQFLAGWALPGTPAARTLVVIHREGQALEQAGRRLEAVARAQRLPEARRASTQIAELGRRLRSQRIGREEAARLLRGMDRQLEATQEAVERRLLAALPGRDGAGADREPSPSESGARRLAALEEAVRELQAVSGRIRAGGPDADRSDVSRRLAALSQSLERFGAPPSVRHRVAEARRDAQRGALSGAAGALSDALQDLQGLERMLGDEQALGEGRREVRRASEKIAEREPSGATVDEVTPQGAAQAVPSRAAGPNPPSPEASDDSVPPPPGPNQGSLPGQGNGPGRGAPTPRLGGTRVPVHLFGVPGEGASSLREIAAPGREGSARLPATPPPATVAREIDRALVREPLPPAYLSVIRRYFETLGGAP